MAFQLADALKKEAYRLLASTPAAAGDWAFANQLRRAASSGPMNIAEGFHRGGTKEFARFLSIALGSIGETRLWLHDGIDRGYFDPAACAHAFDLGRQCRAVTLALRRSLILEGS